MQPSSSAFERTIRLQLVAAVAVLVLLMGLSAFGFYRWQQHQQLKQYQAEVAYFNHHAVQGFDVSHHQGEIDWALVPKQFSFVYLKATEGGDYQDPNFKANWQGARQQGFKVGAYHYYRYCTAVERQTAHFIASVPKHADSLPPVIDIEFQYNCPGLTAQQLKHNLHLMAQALEQHYGKRPIFYTTPNFYRIYLQTEFAYYPLWIQDLKHQPDPHDPRPWLIWQYSQQGKIDGITGDVDRNVFRGNAADLAWLTISTTSTTSTTLTPSTIVHQP